MLLHNKLQKDYTLNQSGYQLKLPLELETIIPENDSVRLLSQFVEEMDLTDLYSTYDRINSLSPRTLLKIVLYSYMNGDYSFRSMELNCKRDINFMFLLEGHSAPDHATLARFRSIHFAPCSKRILAEVSNILFDLDLFQAFKKKRIKLSALTFLDHLDCRIMIICILIASYTCKRIIHISN